LTNLPIDTFIAGMDRSASDGLFARAQRLIPGGVNSPVRAFRAVGGVPPFIERAEGSRVQDVDGNEYIDYVCSWGPAILGHAHPAVVSAVAVAAARGLSYGAPTAQEVQFAEAITERYPSIEMMRCVSSGTEATMSALRAARGFTGRDFIVKFEGGYHGHSDGLLVKAGSGLSTFGIPDSAGVPDGVAKYTLTEPYNNVSRLQALFEQRGQEIAAVIVEPVAGNMGCVPPAPKFLATIIALCKKFGSVSVFDEVITGGRLSRGGAQQHYGLTPDMTCLGKVIGGGMPLALYGGRREIMSCISPLGPVYQAGTLSGNPVALAAGLSTLNLLDAAAYRKLDDLAAQLADGLSAALIRTSVSGVVQRVGSLLTLFFVDKPVTDFASANASDRDRFARWHRALLGRGIYWPPSQLETAFVSLAHSPQDVTTTLEAAEAALCEARQ
jgi:glutamate-1-semialdehyde 2,1-aminomutase